MTFKAFLDRYGLSIGVLVVFAAVIAVLPGNASQQRGESAGSGRGGGIEGDAGQPGDGAGTAGSVVGDGGAVAVGGGSGGTTGGTTGSAPAAGSAPGGSAGPSGGSSVSFGKGPDCDANGRQKGISGYMPPCVQWTGTDNGGATARGVTKDKILVISWLGQEKPGTRQALTGARLNDDPATVKKAFEALFTYSNQHYQTYGRDVVFEELAASGDSESDEAMTADAVRIASERKAFAVFAGNALAPIPTTLARELAQRGVICICTTSLSSEFYNELPATIFSSLPTINEYAINAAEYAAKRLRHDPAVFGGVGTNTLPRTYCLMYLNGTGTKVDPEGERAHQIFNREFARRGLSFKTAVSYLYDPGNNQNDVTTMIAKLKAEKCTTIVPVVDPIQPILITREATKQAYFPEWFIIGTGLSDTSTIGRFYDDQQWNHAFGISPLWVTWSHVETSAGYREWHHAFPNTAKGGEGVLVNIYRAPVQTLFRGIHMAGPNLTNGSFAAGIYAYPPSGGKPASPLVFVSRQYPTEIKDWSEIWWDPNQVGPDERTETGKGMMMRADGGRRYKAGQWPTGPPSRANAVMTTDEQNNPAHEQDRHTHTKHCLSCAS
ncbi:MAG: hypothetical protein ABIY48_09035 [Acidimicrobiales bacterium]